MESWVLYGRIKSITVDMVLDGFETSISLTFFPSLEIHVHMVIQT